MISWSKIIEESMIKHAEDSYPYECCGFILGHHSTDHCEAIEIVPVDNTHSGEKRRRFYIDPLSYMKAERTAEGKGLQLIGVYHSHPDHPPIPSEEDKKHALPEFHYPIISVQNGKESSIRSWMLEGSRKFYEISILKTDK